MKKSLLWMFAAILTSGMTMTSCSTEDNEVNQKESSKFMDSFDFEDGDVSMFQIVDPARSFLQNLVHVLFDIGDLCCLVERFL